MPLEEVVEKKLPNFGYQLQFASGEVEKKLSTKEDLRLFLNGMYGGRGPNNEIAWLATEGVQYHNLPKLGPTPLLDQEELQAYTEEYARHGLHGPLNWYRTSKFNHEDEVGKEGKLEMPILFVSAKRDGALKPEMSQGMEKSIPNLVRHEVNTGHWALWEAPKEISDIVKGWFETEVFGGGKESRL